MEIKRKAEKKLEEINKTIEYVRNELTKAPDGTLEINRRGKTVYYQKNIAGSGKSNRLYIPVSRRELAMKLAQKGYYKKLLPVLLNEKKTLEEFIRAYNPGDKFSEYEQLCNQRKSLIRPLFQTPEQIVKDWQAEEYAENDFFAEKKIYETDRGEMVRSKSEVIIANYLNSCKELDYRYEKPLYLPDEYNPLYPDFSVINIIIGRKFYYEHCGMMSDPEYSNDFIKKEKKYINAGLIPGRDVFFTFESAEYPFDQKTMKRIVAVMQNCDDYYYN